MIPDFPQCDDAVDEFVSKIQTRQANEAYRKKQKKLESCKVFEPCKKFCLPKLQERGLKFVVTQPEIADSENFQRLITLDPMEFQEKSDRFFLSPPRSQSTGSPRETSFSSTRRTPRKQMTPRKNSSALRVPDFSVNTDPEILGGNQQEAE